jgi:hypothetical protein
MRAVQLLPYLIVTLAPLVAASQCSQTESPADSGVTEDADAMPPADGSDAPTTKRLGDVCATGPECASEFCVDGVCCESACADTCYSCAQSTVEGTCLPIRQGEDPSATQPCSGRNGCFVDGVGAPTCKLQDKESCSGDDQCGSGFCPTYFADADRDGYGVASSPLSICDTGTTAPPAGYAALAGDCCDRDRGTHPDLSTTGYFATANACGSFDWNCDGAVQRQTTTPCPRSTGGATSVECGASCYLMNPQGGGSMKLFTQACR